nr:unnamed protein product [Digitaria exilis]
MVSPNARPGTTELPLPLITCTAVGSLPVTVSCMKKCRCVVPSSAMATATATREATRNNAVAALLP